MAGAGRLGGEGDLKRGPQTWWPVGGVGGGGGGSGGGGHALEPLKTSQRRA